MKTGFLIFMLMVFFQGFAFAYSVEITTGSGKREGVVDSSGRALKDGSLVQIIMTKDGIIHGPVSSGADPDLEEIISTTEVGNNFPFNRNSGKFDTQVWLAANEKIYLRVFNDADPVKATELGESGVFSPSGFDGEMWDINGGSDVAAIVLKKKGKQ